MRITTAARLRTPSEAWSRTEANIKIIEVAVLARLSGKEDPPTRADLELAIGGSPLDVSNALHNLAVAGLVDLGELRVALTPRRATEQMPGTVPPPWLGAGSRCVRRTPMPRVGAAMGRAER